jgi:hypothetical protein
LLAVVVWKAGYQTTFMQVVVPPRLTVISAHDSPTPNGGVYAPGTTITASVTSPVAGSSGTQYVCTGWTGTGDVPVSGTDTTVTFTIDRDSSITWTWKTHYYLTVKVVPSGVATIPGEDWYDAPGPATLTAPCISGTYRFWGWDLDGVFQGNTNPLMVVMNAAHTATAHYSDSAVGGQWAPTMMQTNVSADKAPLLVLSMSLTLATAVPASFIVIRHRRNQKDFKRTESAL